MRRRSGSRGAGPDDVELGFPIGLYEQMGESVAVYTREARYLYINPTTARMFDKTLGELRGRIAWEVFPEAVGTTYHRAFERVARSGHPEHFDHLYEPWNKWFETHIYLVDARVWVIGTDITTQRNIEELERAQAARLRILSETSRALAEAPLDVRAVLETVASEVAKHLGDACRVSLLEETGQSVAGSIAATLAVPLRARGHVIGSVQAWRFTPGRPYSPDDQRLLEELAERSALAIENARLHQQMRTHAQVLESMSEGVLVSNEDGFILYTNPALDRMFGYGPGELLGKHVTALNTYPPEESEPIVKEVIAELRTKGVWVGEWSNIKKDKTRFITRAHISALELDGRPHWVSVQEDVTEQKRIEKERATLLADARHAREKLQLIIDALPALISYVDTDGRYRLNNLTYEKWFGLSREEIYGKHLREVLGEAAFEAVRPDVEQALSGSTVSHERELPYMNVGSRWVQSTCIPDIDAAGNVRGFIVLVQDIHERKLHEEELRKRAELEQHLLGIVSHDLRNPIGVMMMSASALLMRKETDPKITKALLRIVSSGERATRMIGDLLDFTQARVMGAGIPIERRPFDFHRHVRHAAEELQAAHPRREILIAASGNGEGAWDPDRITQLVVNLVSNALAYSPETTPVHVGTSGDEHSLSLTVHNSGTPIPAETMRVMFEPFKRGKERSESTSRSVGLGLYIVKQLVIAHGGTIDLRSTEAEGTTFTVRLPRGAVAPSPRT